MTPAEPPTCPIERAQRAVEEAGRLLERPDEKTAAEAAAHLEEAIAAVAQLESDLRSGWRPADPAALRRRLAAWRARLHTAGALVDNLGRLHAARLELIARQGGYDRAGRCAIPSPAAARLAVEA
jgi:hypothetical protein